MKNTYDSRQNLKRSSVNMVDFDFQSKYHINCLFYIVLDYLILREVHNKYIILSSMLNHVYEEVGVEFQC